MMDLVDSAVVPIPSAVAVGRIPRRQIQEAVVLAMADPDPANLFMRLYYIFQSIGMFDQARDMHAKALERRKVYRLEVPATPTLRLLAILGPDPERDNAPIEYVVDGSDIRLEFLYFNGSDAMPLVLPDHDVAFVGIGESEQGNVHLNALEGLLHDWPRPVLNRPAAILRCARDRLRESLAGLTGVRIPAYRRIGKDGTDVTSFPCVIRPLDAHAGKGFEKIDDSKALAHYLAHREEDAFYVADYLDYRSADGQFRKYRIALIDHQPHLCHVAIADDWMVHYITAGMERSAQKQAEEAGEFANFHQSFGLRHGKALTAVAEAIALDYVVLDCGEMPDGQLIVFEADIRSWVHDVDPADLFPYKSPHMKQIFAAFRQLLFDRQHNPRQV